MFPFLECCCARTLLQVGDLVIADVVDIALTRPGGKSSLASFGGSMSILIELGLHLLVELNRLGFHCSVRLSHGPHSDVVEAGDGGIETGSHLGLGDGDGLSGLSRQQGELLIASN